jgi:hypothetical protein
MFMSMRQPMSLNCRHQRVYCSSPRWYMSTESHSGMILTGETEELGENLSQCHFFHRKYHMDWPGSEPVPLLWEAGD